MSIEYSLINKNRKNQLTMLQDFLLQERETLLKNADQFLLAHPELEDVRDDILYRIESSNAFHTPDYEEDQYILGVRTSTRFIWRVDNGFTGVESVRSFLNEHCGWIIENEYEAEIPFDEFVRML